jgi:hypothetical protein
VASKEQKHPFYKPLWRRVAIVIVIALWLAFEIYKDGGTLWIMIAAAMLVYAVYTFLITWPKDEPGDDAAPRG